MQYKTQENVHFLDSITEEDEFNLIYEEKERQNKTKTFGKMLLLPENELIQAGAFVPMNLFYNSHNENCFYVYLMLLSCNVFRNFINKCNTSISNMTHTPVLHSFCMLMSSKEHTDVEKYLKFEDCTDIVSGYSCILKSLHNELCKLFYFEENAWTSTKKGKAFKNIYSEYSPIVEIFQGKLSADEYGIPAGYFEIMDKMGSGALNTKSCHKRPYVVLIKTDELIDLETYAPSCVICKADEISNIVVFYDNSMYKYTNDGLEKVHTVDNIQCVLYTKNK